jgi:hypothetical protein
LGLFGNPSIKLSLRLEYVSKWEDAGEFELILWAGDGSDFAHFIKE